MWITGCKLQSLDAPNLHGLVLNVARGATILDKKYARFGWREWTINGRELRLNGTKIQLNGDLKHPFGPFIGSRRYAWAWMKMVQDVGGNAIRPHAQPRPRFYLDLRGRNAYRGFGLKRRFSVSGDLAQFQGAANAGAFEKTRR